MWCEKIILLKETMYCTSGVIEYIAKIMISGLSWKALKAAECYLLSCDFFFQSRSLKQRVHPQSPSLFPVQLCEQIKSKLEQQKSNSIPIDLAMHLLDLLID